MNGLFKSGFIAVALLCVLCGTAVASTVTQNITYQGVLTDSSGNPLTGTYSITFNLYDASTGGNLLSTSLQSVQVTNGQFTTPVTFDSSIFNGQALWIGITIGSDAEMTPRQEIRPVPYALNLRPGAVVIGASFTTNQAGSNLTGAVPGLEALTSYYQNPGIVTSTTGQHSHGIWSSTTGQYSDGVYVTTAGSTSPGVNVFTSNTGSPGVNIATSNSDGVDITTSGNSGNYTIGPTSIGVKVSTSGQYSTGVYASTTAFGSKGVYASTAGSDSDGVDGIATGPNSYGVMAISAQSDGIYAATGSSTAYGIATPNKIDAAGGLVTNPVDVAEYMPASGDVSPGTVLVIGPDGNLTPSTSAYDTKVAGIVSTNPGVTLGKNEDGNIGEGLIAVAGRVPCKVDATNAPIHAGDLLTTSDSPGYAMKATDPKIGTILGKAMGSLESGTGTIEVIVTLQ